MHGQTVKKLYAPKVDFKDIKIPILIYDDTYLCQVDLDWGMVFGIYDSVTGWAETKKYITSCCIATKFRVGR